MAKEFLLKEDPLPSVKKQTRRFDPEIVIRGFGLQVLKSRFYNFQGDQEEDETAGTSYLGTPVFMNLELLPGQYIDKDGNSIEYGEILKNNDDNSAFRIDTVLADVSQTKQIIKTNIQGVKGTVKEYISEGDYRVTLRGAIVNEEGQRYPEDQVKQLKEYLSVEAEIGELESY